MRILVVAIGNEWRSDDGVGPAILRALSAERSPAADFVTAGPLADELDLLGLWDDADLAVVLDATRSGVPPGTVTRVDLDDGDGTKRPASTHGIGVAGTLAIARSVGRAPRRVVLVGVEGFSFEQGGELSPSVAGAVPQAAAVVRDLLSEALGSAASAKGD